jgi:3',5'-cyclic-AMP phosphodiesterase
MKLAWISDPHMEWMAQEHLDTIYNSLRDSETEGVIVSGDISDSRNIKKSLSLFARLPIPVYFVLGNHDTYGSSFEYVRNMIRKSVRHSSYLVWLTESAPVQLTEQTYLIGHDGWADGRAGLGQQSGYMINDYQSISDFRGMSIGSVFTLMQKKADLASRRLETQIRKLGAEADASHLHIIIVTHAPPFEEACLYQGHATDPYYIPHFSNIGMGQMLEKVTRDVGCRVSVLCGHTHHEHRININNKIGVWVGPPMSVYNVPVYTVVDADLGC